MNIVDEKIKAAQELCRIISEVYSEAERDVYIGVVSEKLSIPRDSLKNDVKRMMQKNDRVQKKEEFKGIVNKTAGYGDRVNPDMMKGTGAVNAEENILGILLLFPENLAQVKKGKLDLSEEDFFSEFGRRIFAESLLRCDDTGKFDIALLNEVFNTDEMGRITSMVVRRRQLTENGFALLRDMISRLKEETKRRKAEGDDLTQIADILANQRSKLKKN